MAHAPPVVRLALAFAVGVAWVTTGAPLWSAPLPAALLLLLPIPTSPSPAAGVPVRLALVASLWVGAVAAGVSAPGEACARPVLAEAVHVHGRFLARPVHGSAPFARLGACPPVTVVVADSLLPAGRTLEVRGWWRRGARGFWFQADTAAVVSTADDAGLRWAVVRWRDGLVRRIEALYGDQAPLVAALTLARREGFDQGLRETFARTGLAHLLAISGFHVGVIAGLVFAALRLTGLPRRTARLGAAGAAWLYVGLIGFPDAACRAAVILACVAASGARGRPPARWGALASAWLVLLVQDPGRLAGPGFQLSFAGAAGLVAWSAPVASALRRLGSRDGGRRGRVRMPDALAKGLSSGVAATVATLPVVAWHFEQVSVVGIPATLVAGPLVAVALPGAIASVALDFLSHDAARFLAGGVSVLLAALERGARTLAVPSWCAIWVSRPTVAASLVGVAGAAAAARAPRVGGRARRALTGTYAVVGVLAWPVIVQIQGRGTAEVVVIDVGQGDAVALRSPEGRWALVDAGPPFRGSDPRGHPAVRALRGRGVGRLEALVLTHADLDHVGGAVAVLDAFEVEAIYDPGLAAGKPEFVEVLRAARAHGVPWRAVRAGDRLEIGGLVLDVLSPSDSLAAAEVETNQASVVLRARFGDFDALLTGDAYKDVERRVALSLAGDVEVLKVGHHGSETSTDELLLDRAEPRVALVSVGRNNRYGHPAPGVLERLWSRSIETRRTDHEGTLTVVARRDGSFRVRGQRSP